LPLEQKLRQIASSYTSASAPCCGWDQLLATLLQDGRKHTFATGSRQRKERQDTGAATKASANRKGAQGGG